MIELLSVLAIWKISTMLMDYAGPFNIFVTMRHHLRNFKGLNFECFFCFSTVISLPFAIYLATGWDIIIFWFGLAGAAWFLEQINDSFNVEEVE